MTKSTLERQVELRLLDHDLRLTTGRRLVLQALASAGGPMSAAELAETLAPDVPLSSLYRTLSLLEDADVVAHHLGAKGLTRFELAEWLTGHHHHLVCLECGDVADIEVPPKQEESVRSLVAEIASSADFRATDHALEIEGRCRRCA